MCMYVGACVSCSVPEKVCLRISPLLSTILNDAIALLQESLQSTQEQVRSLESERNTLASQLTSEKDDIVSQHKEEVEKLKKELDISIWQYQQDMEQQKALHEQSKSVGYYINVV